MFEAGLRHDRRMRIERLQFTRYVLLVTGRPDLPDRKNGSVNHTCIFNLLCSIYIPCLRLCEWSAYKLAQES